MVIVYEREVGMNFLGMGPGELILILIIALVIFGPGKLPELGRALGKAMRDFRQMSQGFTAELNKEFKDLEEATREVRQTAQTIQQVTKLPQALPDVAKQAIRSADRGSTELAEVSQRSLDGEETPAPTKAEPAAAPEEAPRAEEKPETPTIVPDEAEQGETVEEIPEEEMI